MVNEGGKEDKLAVYLSFLSWLSAWLEPLSPNTRASKRGDKKPSSPAMPLRVMRHAAQLIHSGSAN